MTDIRYHYVDVFASRPLTGNPVTVVPDADRLDPDLMRAIAREFNQSETTFVLTPTNSAARARLRSFTPIGAEVFGAGHNALGAWLLLARLDRLPAGERQFVQEIGDALLPVEVTWDGDRPAVSMRQSAPVFGDRLAPPGALAVALRIGRDAVLSDPARVVSTGAGHLLVPLRDRAAVDACVPDAERLIAVVTDVGGEGCYVYSRETVSSDAVAYTRFFNPTMGIGEDPATGTAAGPLVAHLVEQGHIPDGQPVIIEQGHRTGRPSRIGVRVRGAEVHVSGTGLIVGEGVLHL